jgi:uncharacterized protein
MQTLRAPLLILLLAMTSAILVAQPEVPVIQQRVTDFTNSLSFNEWRALETRLKQFEDSTSTQIAILLLSSLDGGSIEDYSMRV